MTGVTTQGIECAREMWEEQQNDFTNGIVLFQPEFLPARLPSFSTIISATRGPRLFNSLTHQRRFHHLSSPALSSMTGLTPTASPSCITSALLLLPIHASSSLTQCCSIISRWIGSGKRFWKEKLLLHPSRYCQTRGSGPRTRCIETGIVRLIPSVYVFHCGQGLVD